MGDDPEGGKAPLKNAALSSPTSPLPARLFTKTVLVCMRSSPTFWWRRALPLDSRPWRRNLCFSCKLSPRAPFPPKASFPEDEEAVPLARELGQATKKTVGRKKIRRKSRESTKIPDLRVKAGSFRFVFVGSLAGKYECESVLAIQSTYAPRSLYVPTRRGAIACLVSGRCLVVAPAYYILSSLSISRSSCARGEFVSAVLGCLANDFR